MLRPPFQGPEAEGHLPFKKWNRNRRLGFPSRGSGLFTSGLPCSPRETKPRCSAAASSPGPPQRLCLLIPVVLRVPHLICGLTPLTAIQSRRQASRLFRSRKCCHVLLGGFFMPVSSYLMIALSTRSREAAQVPDGSPSFNSASTFLRD